MKFYTGKGLDYEDQKGFSKSMYMKKNCHAGKVYLALQLKLMMIAFMHL